MTLRGAWKRICDAVIPPSLAADPDQLRRAELLVAFILVVGAGLVFRAPTLFWGGLLWQAFLVTGTALWLAGTLLHLKRTGALVSSANRLVTGLFVVGSSAAWSRGGIGAPVLVSLSAVPLLALFLAGPRSGTFWLSVYSGEVVLFGVVEGPLGFEVVDRLPPSTRLVVETVGALLFGGVLFGIGLAFEWLKKTALEARAAAEQKRHQAEEAARMVHADRMASVGLLAAGVAHEINNPLSYIAGNLEFIGRELSQMTGAGVRAELALALAEARQGIERVGLIVRDLKTFAREDDQESKVVDLRELVSAAMRIAENELRHRATVDVVLPETPVWVRGNDTRLVQVLLNVLLNAAQAIPPGHAEENAVCVRVGSDAGRVLVDVEDTGAGMTPEVLAKATEPFFTTKPVGVGTGLGLSVSANVIRALGGELTLQSQLGRGTTVAISLPGSDAPEREAPSRPGEGAVTEARRILLVDDEPLVIRALSRVFRGHDVTSAASGREAVSLLEQDPAFDVILCDLMMPDLTGADVYQEVERLGNGAHRKIVFLTGGVFTDGLRAFLDRIDNPRYTKPIRPAEVEEILRATRLERLT